MLLANTFVVVTEFETTKFANGCTKPPPPVIATFDIFVMRPHLSTVIWATSFASPYVPGRTDPEQQPPFAMESDIYYSGRKKDVLNTPVRGFGPLSNQTMSVRFNNHGLLCGYPGEEEGESPVFTWTYAGFEKYLNESITPSMYRFMAEYVRDNLSKDDLYEIQGGDYCPGDLEEGAVDAYFDMPMNQKIALHEQVLTELRNEKAIAEAKEAAAIDALLDDATPFGTDSPINYEYIVFINGLVIENRKKADLFENQIHEEEQWRGGHEEGAEDF